MRDEGRLFRVRVFVSDKTGTLAALTALLAKAGANILETNHERSFSRLPSGVDISFRLEARNEKHQNEIVQTLIEAGLAPEVMR
jgi:threonine dehydratase